MFGDVISEIDWGVGQIFESLKKTGIDETRASYSHQTTVRGCRMEITVVLQNHCGKAKGRISRVVFVFRV